MTIQRSDSPIPVRSAWHAFFGEAVRLVLAPLILLVSGFFTANFFISGKYTWPQTSRAIALTLTVVILSYEFVYKEQLAHAASVERARQAVAMSCLLPYLLGGVVMLVIWKL
jgi:hypothetical protein